MKDPAVLFYVNDWLTSTAEMDSDVRGWYLNLILHNYDKKSLPNDIEKLAVLAGVKFSEFNRFEQVFEQVLKQKFEQEESGRLTNRKTDSILRDRENFKEKRSQAGKVSYIMKYMAKNFNKEYRNKGLRDFTKENFDYEIDLKSEQVLKHVFKQVFELYISENEIENESKDSNTSLIKKDKNKIPEFGEFFEYAKTLENYSTGLDFTIKAKYDSWIENNWKDGNGNKINNWKTKLRNTWPHLKPMYKPKDDGRISAKDYFKNLRNGTGLPQNENKFIE